MKQAVLLVVSILSYAAASDTIMPLFETDSIAAYDRWLWHHRSEYPGFRPVRAMVGTEKLHSGWTRAYAVALTDSGTVQVRHVYPDSWDDRGMVAPQMSAVHVTEDGDGFAVGRYRGKHGVMAYDRLGRKLFDSEREVVPRFGLWFRDMARPRSGMVESTQVLNDEGRVVGTLPSVSVSGACTSGDTLFAAPSRRGTIVFDNKARILWRDTVLRAGQYAATFATDGREVAIANRDSIVLHDLTAGTTTASAVATAADARRGLDIIAWSSDSRRIAMYRRDTAVPDSATLSILTRDGRLAVPPRRLEATYSERLFWMGDTVVLVASPYNPNMRKWLRDKPLQRGSCKVTAVAPSGKTQEWIVPGQFGRHARWYQQGRKLLYIRWRVAVFEVPVR